MTSTAIKIATKIDDFAIAISIGDLAELTTGLLQLQHARYPHLVPMYRTIHRTKPRTLVLRAIRWVNPKRMFPGAGLTTEEMENMSKEGLEKLIVKLNDYRGEAHVIHNRYNQMIDMINMGELPYFIPYAGFKQDKWTMLQEYMDRAMRLKDGTKEWEQVLDRQALEIRELLHKKHNTRLDDISGLWVDAKGEKAAPNFMDVKKGKEAKRLLRQVRISPDGKRVLHRPKVYARVYIAVPKAEQRPGEEIRMPAGGRVRRPRDPKGRKIYDEHGGAAAHLVRMPKGPFMGTDNPDLRKRGQLLSMPAGRKNPQILTYSEVSDDAVANRRVGRWTHTDPLGMRGAAPHRGAASRGRRGTAQEGPAPHPAEVSEPSRLRQREDRIRDRQRQRPAPVRPPRPVPPPRPPSVRQEEPAEIRKKAIAINEHFNKAAVNLFKQHNIDTSTLEAMKAISDADVASVSSMGGGVNASATLKITLTDGRKFMYKIVEGEQKSEQLADILDKVLDLNTQVNAVIHNDISIDTIRNKGVNVSNRVATAQERGGGHLQTWCEPNCSEWGDVNLSRQTDLFKDDAFRESYLRMTLLDFVGGNWDRHRMNFMVTSDGKLQGIDNGFHGGYAEVHEAGPLDDPGQAPWIHGGGFGRQAEIKPGLFAKTPGRDQSRHHPMRDARRGSGIDRPQVQSEAEAVFDRHFDEDKIRAIQQELGLANQREGQSFEQIRNDYLKYVEAIT